MKCDNCGAEMKVEHRDHRYSESGLDNVMLHGVEFRICPKCGEEELVIHRMEQLHRVIAEGVASKPEKLTGAEIRFLRKHLGWAAEDFAETMGVTKFTVSRWENEREDMGPVAERLLRLMALREKPVKTYPNERLAKVARRPAKAVRMDLKAHRSGWREVEAQ